MSEGNLSDAEVANRIRLLSSMVARGAGDNEIGMMASLLRGDSLITLHEQRGGAIHIRPERVAHVEPWTGGSRLTFSEPIRTGVDRYVVVRESMAEVREMIAATPLR